MIIIIPGWKAYNFHISKTDQITPPPLLPTNVGMNSDKPLSRRYASIALAKEANYIHRAAHLMIETVVTA